LSNETGENSERVATSIVLNAIQEDKKELIKSITVPYESNYHLFGIDYENKAIYLTDLHGIEDTRENSIYAFTDCIIRSLSEVVGSGESEGLLNDYLFKPFDNKEDYFIEKNENISIKYSYDILK
jgi:hypothetical protein